MKTLMVAEPAVNMARYIPVEEATVGCISSRTMTGLKMAAGPSPTAVAEKAPKNA